MTTDLNYVRQLFSQPDKLKAADFIYREIASRMLERLQLVRLNPTRVIDAGCGRGADLAALHTYYPKAHIIGVDALLSVLQQSSRSKSFIQKLFGNKPANTINGDFCHIPLKDQSVELVWSNLALHWHGMPEQVFKEWRRILNVDGLLMFSCFGPDTLKELRQAVSQEEQRPHSMSLVDMHDLGDMLVYNGFATPVMDMEFITLTYATVEELFADARAWGIEPLLTSSIKEGLEQSRQNGRIPLTLEVIYGHAFRPVAKQIDPNIHVIQFDKLKNR